MEIKPSFFSISGFLAPGLVTVLVFAGIYVSYAPDTAERIFDFIANHKIEGAGGAIIGVVFVATLAAATFVLGSVLSDGFTLIGRHCIMRLFIEKRRNLLKTHIEKTSLDELLLSNLTPREAYVYIHTCGIDLHWNAGRVRMIGGSGVGLLLAAGFSLLLPLCACRTTIVLIGSGLILVTIALHRSYQFDKYVAATAAVLRFSKPSKLSGDL
jgi:hypothetical protein